MKTSLCATVLVGWVLLGLCPHSATVNAEGQGAGLGTRINGDVNCSADLDMSDAVYLLNFLFLSTAGPPCPLEDPPDLVAQIAQLETDLEAANAGLEAANADLDNLQLQLTQTQESLAACTRSSAGFTFLEINVQGYAEYTHDETGIVFVHLPGGSFEMGSPESETGRRTDEGPVHTVSLSPFLIAKYEVTQAEYEAVMVAPPAGLSATPSQNRGDAPASDQRPVETVSWDDLHLADGFLERTGLSLPSEAQWEYACRAGTPGKFGQITQNEGQSDEVVGELAWYAANSGGDGSDRVVRTHDVGGKRANPFGLHDMHGNVAEWCEDTYVPDAYGTPVPGFDIKIVIMDGEGSGCRSLRGGSYADDAHACRSAAREGFVAGAHTVNEKSGTRPVACISRTKDPEARDG